MTPVSDLADLQEIIYAGINNVTPQILHKLWIEVEYWLDISSATNGSHVEVYGTQGKKSQLLLVVVIGDIYRFVMPVTVYDGCSSVAFVYWLRPGADQSSKAAFCKGAFAKSELTFGKSAFARSRFSFRQSIFASQKAMVWSSATIKMISAKTCQNVLESIFAFCSIDVRQSYL